MQISKGDVRLKPFEEKRDALKKMFEMFDINPKDVIIYDHEVGKNSKENGSKFDQQTESATSEG